MIIKDILHLVKKERKKQKRAEFVRKYALGAGLITAAGVTIGLLFATRAGADLREDVSGRTVNAIVTMKDRLKRAKENAKDHVSDTMDAVHKGMRHIGHKTEKIQGDVVDGMNEISENVQEIVKD